MSRWLNRQELRLSLREHPWVWKAPFLAITTIIWVGAALFTFGVWQGESNSPSRTRTLPPPAVLEADDSAEERVPRIEESSANSLIGDPVDTTDPTVDGASVAAAETTEVSSAPSNDSVPEVAPTLAAPVATDAVESLAEPPPRRSSRPTAAPPTVTSTAPPAPIVTAPPVRPPTITVVRPTTRPPTVTIPRPTAPTTTPPATTSPPVTQPPTVPSTAPPVPTTLATSPPPLP